ncbi:alpha/beta hydrolase [Clostridium psychrophilum]|nr:alpha/beta hydrolase [Clostridium psychrophilum]
MDFKTAKYTLKTVTVDNKAIKYRSYEKIVYVTKPVDTKYEIMNVYVPEAYFKGKSIGNYNTKTAPIFLPNTIGGYMPGTPGNIGSSVTTATTNMAAGMGAGTQSYAVALSKGYVVVSPGARGRTTTTGKAPAAVVDLKAAVAYIHHNDAIMSGDANKIISDGTSAGGAMSALLGATGNNSDYEPYLKAIGAADASTSIFAVASYCPITNLDNADAAYEWSFNGLSTYASMATPTSGTKPKVKGTKPKMGKMPTTTAKLTANQIKLSNELKTSFPSYVNSLGLKSTTGTSLTLAANGTGTFKDYYKSFVIASAQKALNSGTDLSKLTWITIKNKKVTDIDYDQYMKYIGRGKAAPAFDDVALTSPETNEFGTTTKDSQHFTKFSMTNNTKSGASMADSKIIKQMNPMNYIGTKGTDTSKYWRIRYGSIDNNTSPAIPLILATKLQNSGYNVDYAEPWGIGHSGDYDLTDLFAWVDKISQTK